MFLISLIWIIWLNIDIFSWIFFFTVLLSLEDVMTWTLLNFTVSCSLDIYSINFCTVVGSFIPLMRIHTLVLFLAGQSTVPVDIVCWPGDIGHIVILTLMCNGANSITYWWERYSHFKYIIFDEGVIWEINFNVIRMETFMAVMILEPGDHPFTNLLLC